MCLSAYHCLTSVPNHHTPDSGELVSGARWAAATKDAGYKPGQFSLSAVDGDEFVEAQAKVEAAHKKRFGDLRFRRHHA